MTNKSKALLQNPSWWSTMFVCLFEVVNNRRLVEGWLAEDGIKLQHWWWLMNVAFLLHNLKGLYRFKRSYFRRLTVQSPPYPTPLDPIYVTLRREVPMISFQWSQMWVWLLSKSPESFPSFWRDYFNSDEMAMHNAMTDTHTTLQQQW